MAGGGETAVVAPNLEAKCSLDVTDFGDQDWMISRAPALYAAQALTAQQIQSFVKFPPRQKPASFNLDNVLERLQEAADGGMH